MTVLRRLGLLFCACLGLLATPALAQEIDATDRIEAQAAVDRFGAVFASGDYAALFDLTVSPGLMAHFQRTFGATEAQIREAVVSGMAQAMGGGVTIVEHTMDVAGASAAVTPDGSRGYLLIPTTTLMEVEGVGRVRSRNNTLAIEEGGRWYLMRIDDAQQVGFLRGAYPEFEGVEFPTGTVEAE